MAVSSWIPPPRPDPETLRNPLPFEPFPLGQIRSGKIKKSLANGRIETAIFKTNIPGPIVVTENGIIGDEHAYEPHRSPDKALLHYCTSHYDEWSREIPASEAHFRPGAFGENIFNAEVSEQNVCIGDRMAIGEIIVEVTEPRAPCYKLNHRFEVKDMAKRTQTLFRTGWLYRIIKPGTIAAGDAVRLLERPHPDWTVARVEYYLFLETDNVEKMKEIVEIPQLGWEIKDKFRARLAKGTTEDQNGRMYGEPADAMDAWYECRIISKRAESSTVTSFTLETIDAPPSPSAVEPGSHVRLKLGGKLVRAYSVTGGTTARFSLGIALSATSRGGSKYLHENVHVGSVITASRITSSFPLAPTADTHIIIAGGIGITAFLAALDHLQETKEDFHLHYAVSAEIPFQAQIAKLSKERVTIYNKSEGLRMDLKAILGHADSRTHIYTCGPARLMDAVVSTAQSLHIEDKQVHMEQFTVITSGDPFIAELQQSKKVVEVGPQQTLLDVLREAGLDVDSSCEELKDEEAQHDEQASGRVEEEAEHDDNAENASVHSSKRSRPQPDVDDDDAPPSEQFDNVAIGATPSVMHKTTTVRPRRPSEAASDIRRGVHRSDSMPEVASWQPYGNVRAQQRQRSHRVLPWGGRASGQVQAARPATAVQQQGDEQQAGNNEQDEEEQQVLADLEAHAAQLGVPAADVNVGDLSHLTNAQRLILYRIRLREMQQYAANTANLVRREESLAETNRQQNCRDGDRDLEWGGSRFVVNELSTKAFAWNEVV
ncbi:hypothetical protein E8E11_002120 [Didymella keratinophila]|nr:hypothetical protein E8E11_002120 [Didymella keratinophila]